MKQFVVLLALGMGAALATTPALADKAAYCQAYARDFSDSRASDKAAWQHKYQIALDACLAVGRKPAAKLASATVAAPAVVKPAAAEAPAAVEATPAKAVDATVAKTVDEATKLVAGSPEWNDYCAKKYTSFNTKTGMYLSHTGVNRRCLVTKG